LGRVALAATRHCVQRRGSPAACVRRRRHSRLALVGTTTAARPPRVRSWARAAGQGDYVRPPAEHPSLSLYSADHNGPKLATAPKPPFREPDVPVVRLRHAARRIHTKRKRHDTRNPSPDSLALSTGVSIAQDSGTSSKTTTREDPEGHPATASRSDYDRRHQAKLWPRTVPPASRPAAQRIRRLVSRPVMRRTPRLVSRRRPMVAEPAEAARTKAVSKKSPPWAQLNGGLFLSRTRPNPIVPQRATSNTQTITGKQPASDAVVPRRRQPRRRVAPILVPRSLSARIWPRPPSPASRCPRWPAVE
jgi:hypothetical protein